MDPETIADYLLSQAGGAGNRPFLYARILTDQLRANPIDTSKAGWKDRVAGSIESAIDTDLSLLPTPEHRDLPKGLTPAKFGRDLLAVLAWSFGAGFPEAEWIAVAERVNRYAVNVDDLDWLLGEAGRYVVQDGEFGVAAYRLAHQSLADYLRPPMSSDEENPFDVALGPIAEALLGLYGERLVAGLSPEEPGYLWHYAWLHAAADGLRGLERLRQLAELEPKLRRKQAAAAQVVSNYLADWGDHPSALPPAQEAVNLLRQSFDATTDLRSELASNLNNLGIRLSMTGRVQEALEPSSEAVELYRDLVQDNAALLPDFASALNNLGVRLGAIGQFSEGLERSEEAVQIQRVLAERDSAFRPSLAMALNNRGTRLCELGRRGEALASVEEAVTLYRESESGGAGPGAPLAGVLKNLGNRLADLGRHEEALAATQEAVIALRGLTASSPANRPDLASAISNLGVRLYNLARVEEAVPLTEEAVSTFRPLSASNEAFLPDLASALNNLGIQLGAVGRYTEAIACAEEAVELRRDLAASNSAFLPALAASLNNLGNRYSSNGRYEEALEVTSHAAELRSELASYNPEILADLANSLNNLSDRLSALRRHSDALEFAREACAILRSLSEENRHLLPDLGRALGNLGVRLGEVNQVDEALAPSREAVGIYRELVEANAKFIPDLALTLDNLGVNLREAESFDDALAATRESESLWRELGLRNSAYLPNLAGALNNLGLCYSSLLQHDQAAVSTGQAVSLYRRIAKRQPWRSNELALALNNFGLCLRDSGHSSDALDPVQEAVEIRLRQAVDDHSLVPELARALNLLESCLADVGRASGGDHLWDAALDSLDSEGGAILYIFRSRLTEAGHAPAASWLLQVSERSTSSYLRSIAHDEARRHAEANPEVWLPAWVDAARAPVPPWLRVNSRLVSDARKWAESASLRDQYHHLIENPHLLESSADAAVDDALLNLRVDDAERLRELRLRARVVGIDSVYEPWLRDQLIVDFASAHPREQLSIFAENAGTLVNTQVQQVLGTLIGRGGADSSVERAWAAVSLALAAGDASLGEQSLTAFGEPERLPQFVYNILHEDWPIEGAGIVTWASQRAFPSSGSLALCMSVVLSELGREEEAKNVLDQLRTLESESKNYVSALLQLVETRPSALELARYLLQLSSEE